MLYFIKGDAPLIHIESEKLAKKFIEDGYIQTNYDMNYYDEYELYNEISTNSMFSNKKLIVLKRAETLKSKGIEKLIKSIEKYNLSSKVLIIIYEEKKSFDKILKEYEIKKEAKSIIDKIGKLIDCSKQSIEKDLTILVQSKLNIGDSEAKKLIKIIGTDYFKLKNELDKIYNYFDGFKNKKYNFEEIKDLISVDIEYNIKELIDNFLQTKDSNKIAEFLNNNPEEINLFIYLLSDEIYQLIKIKSLISENIFNKSMSYNVFKDIYKDYSNYFINRNYVKSHPYPIFLKLSTADNFKENELKLILKDLTFLEYEMKSGEIENIKILAYIFKMFKK